MGLPGAVVNCAMAPGETARSQEMAHRILATFAEASRNPKLAITINPPFFETPAI
jgi:hypothetical protein